MVNQLLTARDVSKVLRIGRTRVYELLNSGRLKGYKLNIKNGDIKHRHWRIKGEDLLAYIESGASGAE